MKYYIRNTFRNISNNFNSTEKQFFVKNSLSFSKFTLRFIFTEFTLRINLKLVFTRNFTVIYTLYDEKENIP